MTTFSMGSKILLKVSDPSTGAESWEPGTVLGLHDDPATFDVLLANGEGKMNVSPADIQLDENAQVADNATADAPKKSSTKSSIGWNASAFTDEAEEVVDDEGGDQVVQEDSTPPVNSNSKKSGKSSNNKFSVGDKVDIKDYATKTYRPCELAAVDEELGTVTAIYEDNGEEGKGIPLTLVRLRKKERKKKSLSKEGGSGDNRVITDINVILATFSDVELQSTLEIVKQLQKFAGK